MLPAVTYGAIPASDLQLLLEMPQNSSTAAIIRIGYFIQESQPPYRIGAIELAVDRARQDGLLPGFSVV